MISMDKLYKKAQDAIERYMQREFENKNPYKLSLSNLKNIELAATTTEDEAFNITATLNLCDFRIDIKVDNVVVKTEQYKSLEDIVENRLPFIEFNDLVSVSDDKLAPFYMEKFLPDEIKSNLDVELEDDDTPFGGKSYSNETVKDFICETYENEEIKKLTLDTLNQDLKNNGIMPIQ